MLWPVEKDVTKIKIMTRQHFAHIYSLNKSLQNSFVTKKLQIFCHAKTNVKLGYYVIPAIVPSPLFFIYVFTNYVDIKKVHKSNCSVCTVNRRLDLSLYLNDILYKDRLHNNINNETR